MTMKATAEASPTNGCGTRGNAGSAGTPTGSSRPSIRPPAAATLMVSSLRSIEWVKWSTWKSIFRLIIRDPLYSNCVEITILIETKTKDALIGKIYCILYIDAKLLHFNWYRHVLKVYPDMTDRYVLPTLESKTWHIKLKLPRRLTCAQCILQVRKALGWLFIPTFCYISNFQWTYDTANSWGTCQNGTEAMGCGPQETFRACSDIKISKRGPRPGSE